MWKEYSRDDLMRSRASGQSVITAVFISALLLSLLCSVLYNVWNYDVVRVRTEDGDYHARLWGDLDEEDLEIIQGYANVEAAWFGEEASKDGRTAVEIRLKDVSSAYEDIPRIVSLAGLEAGSAEYHEELLNLYLTVNPDRPDAMDVYAFLGIFAAAALCASISLILVIHHSFGVFMDEKIPQLGVLAGVGAAPGQIWAVLMQEAAALSVLPSVLGSLLGLGAGAGMMAWIDLVRDRAVEDAVDVAFACHPLVFAAALLCTAVTVGISAWIPARRLGRISPMEAVRGVQDAPASLPGAAAGRKKRRNPRLLRLLFGVEGELAGNALRARRKRLRTASFSLVLSFLGFGFMLCFFRISSLSVQISYFDGIANQWDVMVTVKDTDIADFDGTDRIQGLSGVRDAAVYQTARAKRFVTEEELSAEFLAAGGFDGAPEAYVTAGDGGWLVNAPVWILDDASFLAYCGHIGTAQDLSGVVVLNQVRDDADPNFRIRNSLPYLKEEREMICLQSAGSGEVTIPVTGYAQEPPVLPADYQDLDYYEMVHILPVSLWEQIGDQVGGAEEDVHIRIFAGEEKTGAYAPAESGGEMSPENLETLEALEEAAVQELAGSYELETNNRIREEEASDRAYGGLTTIVGGFCVLLAVIGIGDVFSNTLGFARQRRREVARYLSVGMTPRGVWKMFWVEALVLAGRPVIISLPVLVFSSWLFMRAAYLDPVLLLRNAPVLPLLAFALADFLFVGLAYYIGGKKVLRINLSDALRDGTF